MRRLVLVGAALTLFAVPVGAFNALQNPGFETGALAPWYQGGGGGPEPWNVTNVLPHSGQFCATDVGNQMIRQDFPAVPTGDITAISFWIKQPEAQISAIDFFYGNSTFEENLVFLTGTDWQQFNVTGWLDPGKTLVGIGVWGYSGGPGGEDRTYLDDVVIDVIPEPSALLLLIAGSGLLRRR